MPSPKLSAQQPTAVFGWPVRGEVARLSGLVLLILFGLYSGAILSAYAFQARTIFADFFGFWSAARFVASHPAAEVYAGPVLDQFQRGLYPQLGGDFPFIYPPDFLLLLWPFGLLPYGAACLLWVVLTVGAYVAALCASRWPRPLVATLLVAPSTTLAIFFGQSGVLAAALIIGGLRLLRVRPVLAGVLLGLAGFKPQLGVLVPVALLAGGHWRSIAAAIVTSLAGVAASGLAFGWSIWPRWIALVATRDPIPTVDRVRLYEIMPTVSAALDLLGARPLAVHLAQLVFALAMLAVTWWLWRERRGPTRLAIAGLATATLLTTPYAFVYDMVLVTGAVLLLVADAMAAGVAFGTAELLVLALALALPAFLLLSIAATLPVSVPVLLALLAVILRRARNATKPAAR